ncbi:MAG: multiheme c-type cytochrome, partial [Desulfobulbales bacterium]|nr:multiheme c-type cytochrome [Desulfobulbales bacterium]
GGGMAIFATANFVGSSRCAVCHELLTDKNGNDMTISGHWRSTMMANAAMDPLWQAKVSSEVKRNPALKQVIEEKCANCHMPMAWTQAYADGEDRLVLEEGFLSPKNDLHAAAMDGVSCSLCHQIQDENLGEMKSFSGKFVIDTGSKGPARKIFGPYENPLQEVMQKGIGFTPAFGPHTNDAALCATCHTLYTPYVDAQGNVAGEFPEQTVYLEWQNSAFGVNAGQRYDIGENPGQGRICQECHMPHSESGSVYIARWTPPKAERKDHFSQHHFVGGNVFMLNVLQDNIGSLGLAASTEKLEDTKERTMHLLQQETARLSLAGLDHRGKELQAVLQVNNLAGHKFPTGIPTRRTWVNFTVADGSGEVFFESGKPLLDGRIQGNDADSNPLGYEPHYNEISRPDQVQIYEGVMLNTDNEVTQTLLRAAKFAKDNRLLPKGYDKAAVPADIAVFGRALADADFTGGSDQVIYRINTANRQGPFTVTARLLFTAVSYPFVRDLEQDRELYEVKRFLQMYRSADKLPQEVAAIRTILQ